MVCPLLLCYRVPGVTFLDTALALVYHTEGEQPQTVGSARSEALRHTSLRPLHHLSRIERIRNDAWIGLAAGAHTRRHARSLRRTDVEREDAPREAAWRWNVRAQRMRERCGWWRSSESGERDYA